jgi:hypothetical protein
MTTEVLNLRRKLRALLIRWSKRQAEYNGHATAFSRDRLSANRYEGIETGTRWCREDIQELMKGLK